MGYKQEKIRRGARDKRVMNRGYSKALRDMLVITRNLKNDLAVKKGFFETEKERKVLSDLFHIVMFSLATDNSAKSLQGKIKRRKWK